MKFSLKACLLFFIATNCNATTIRNYISFNNYIDKNISHLSPTAGGDTPIQLANLKGKIKKMSFIEYSLNADGTKNKIQGLAFTWLFDDTGRIKEQWQLNKNGKIKSKTFYKDFKENKINTYESYENGETVLKIQYTYNELGLLIDEHTNRNGKESQINHQVKTDGNITTHRTYFSLKTYKSGQLIEDKQLRSSRTIEYTYYPDGGLRQISSSYDGRIEKIDSINQYGNIESSHSYSYHGSKLKGTSITTVEYEKNNKQIKQIHTAQFEGQQTDKPINQYSLKYMYDEEKLISEHEGKTLNIGYEYNDNGDVILEDRRYRKRFFKYEKYDHQNNWLIRIKSSSNGPINLVERQIEYY